MLFAQILQLLSWLAIPVTLVCIADDWFLRHRRVIAAAPQPAVDPPLMRALYMLLPLLILASVYRMLTAERADFSAVLVFITFASGIVWAVDHWLLLARRERDAQAAGKDPVTLPEPGTVDYARSFFPVAAVLLILRSFLFEPYRIPSDSMMPTLLDGDFIVVNKYSYGLRWPVTHEKFLDVGEPQRGDVVVFRFPDDPSVNYIKRVVGLPGDRVEVRSDQLIINGEPVSLTQVGRYDDGCYLNMRLAEERLGQHTHKVLHCLSPDNLQVPPLPGCNREIDQGYVCNEVANGARRDPGDVIREVPQGQYLMVGDNRDNSYDGRFWGYVDETLLVGKATRIWFNWDLQRSGGPNWSRIGTSIE